MPGQELKPQKAVLISIQPQWCELIANGKKTVEVRKTKPNLPTPFKVYIYCTKAFKPNTKYGYKLWAGRGKVLGEFVCDKIFSIDVDFNIHDELPGSPMETWLTWEDAPDGYETSEDIENATCLTIGEIGGYIGAVDGCFCWHISDLEIYDTPKELSSFMKPCDSPYQCDTCKDLVKHFGCGRTMLRPPQSWCYVQEV